MPLLAQPLPQLVHPLILGKPLALLAQQWLYWLSP